MPTTIFAIDDSVEVLLSIGATLEPYYDVRVATSGEEGLALVAEIHPALILLDVMMPGIDGYQTCSRIKENPATVDIPIIFLTTMQDTADKIKGLEVGGRDYITKPFSGGELLARIRTQLEISSLTDQLMKVNRNLRRKQALLENDLKAAAEIQKSFLPSKPPKDNAIEVAWQFQPCDAVGGDILNIFRLDKDHYGLYVLDVCGHGVPAAMVTASVHQQLHSNTGMILKMNTSQPPYYEIVSPAEVLANLDKSYPLERFDKYFTISYMVLNTRNGQILYSSAGHPPPLLLKNDGELLMLKEGGTIIGLGGILPFDEGKAQLEPGDILFLYTDGLPEYRNGGGELFSDKRFQITIGEQKGRSAEEATEAVVKAVISNFGAGIPPQDDITLLAVRYLGGSGQQK
ncbi:SpoIIE family protein phosphatase [Desulforhopalus vacuolatus]|uniref:PP2C family protein-serine/threonine phosphatase n=1 Tax=Desulforhopalus vacuolatus TaxID=40414 RepID=UPI00196384B7|nr:SpoIIE family protein phosphatase [Desulforhopalus vacuolatus]MBM9520180.1 SpoIIE family protein phosphatase [Desulforhopalus vacuolatus]